jgi:hypothetical protein
MAHTSSGQVRYTRKTPYGDGTTQIVLEPLDLMARLAALVAPPRMHLTRYHGVFAPHSKLRAAVTPAHPGSGAAKQPVVDPARPPTPRHVAMSCARCGGKLKVIASIEDPPIIAQILSHLERAAPEQHQPELPLGAHTLEAAPRSSRFFRRPRSPRPRRHAFLLSCMAMKRRGKCVES